MKFTGSITASVLVAGLSLGLGSTALLTVSAGGAWARASQAGDNGNSSNAGSHGSAHSNHSNGNGKSATAGSNGNAYGKSASAGSNGKGIYHKGIAQQLKNLNAMCANGNAWSHAAGGSNIGLMRDYRGKLAAADTAQANVNQAASDLSANYGIDVTGLDSAAVMAEANNLANQEAAALWPTDSTSSQDPSYQADLTQYKTDNNIAAATDLSSAQLADFVQQYVDPHNTGVQNQYDPQIAALTAYSGLLGTLTAANDAADTSLMTATHQRGLTGEALTVFQAAMRTGC